LSLVVVRCHWAHWFRVPRCGVATPGMPVHPSFPRSDATRREGAGTAAASVPTADNARAGTERSTAAVPMLTAANGFSRGQRSSTVRGRRAGCNILRRVATSLPPVPPRAAPVARAMLRSGVREGGKSRARHTTCCNIHIAALGRNMHAMHTGSSRSQNHARRRLAAPANKNNRCKQHLARQEPAWLGPRTHVHARTHARMHARPSRASPVVAEESSHVCRAIFCAAIAEYDHA
jgi:hypothetical protein